jgi:hypothetical protein
MNLVQRILRRLNQHRTTQTYFVGYPKTGNTWVRVMLGRYVQLACQMSELPLFDSTDYLGRCTGACIGPRMQFTHRPLTWESQTAGDLNYGNVVGPFTDKRVVLIVRHPLDALVSSWQQRRHRSAAGYSGSLMEFLDDPVHGLSKLLRYYRLWERASSQGKHIHLLRYEDLMQDAIVGFEHLLEFIDIDPSPELVSKAVDYASFENMKKLETAGDGPRYTSTGLEIFATGDRRIPDAFHVRRGKVEGFREYLGESEAAHYQGWVAREGGEWLKPYVVSEVVHVS